MSSPWLMLPARMLRRFPPPGHTAPWRGTHRGLTCCSSQAAFNHSPVPTSVAAKATHGAQTCIGSPARRATPQWIITDRRMILKYQRQLRTGLLFVLLLTSCSPNVDGPADPHTVRCAVIGGMTMTGLW